MQNCSDCCPCRAWHNRCWSVFPPFLLWKPFPCRQPALETLGSPRALQGKLSVPCGRGSFSAWRVMLLVPGLTKREDVSPLPPAPLCPLGHSTEVVSSSERWERGTDSSAGSCAPALPTRAAQSTLSPLQHKLRLLLEPGGIRDPRAPSSRATPALPPLCSASVPVSIPRARLPEL